MEEEQIEIWYEEEKQNLSDRYLHAISRGVSLEKREKRFSRKMDRLAREYERRHTKLRAKTVAGERRKKLGESFARPFKAVHAGVRNVSHSSGSGIRKVFKAGYEPLCFRTNLLLTRHSHKIPDWFASRSRPVYYFYVRHLQEPFRIIALPFVKTASFFRWMVSGIGRLSSRCVSGFVGWVRIFAKHVAKHFLALYRGVSAEVEALHEQYNAWQSHRVQEHLDKKHAKVEVKRQNESGKESGAEAV
ncbi:hypothetical protein ACFL3V_04315 [Nanoarchaeota archaeon]